MPDKLLKLTARETEVVCGILCGKTYEAIAKDLSLSRETIKTYVARIRVKTETRNKVTLAVWAAERVRERVMTCGNC